MLTQDERKELVFLIADKELAVHNYNEALNMSKASKLEVMNHKTVRLQNWIDEHTLTKELEEVK